MHINCKVGHQRPKQNDDGSIEILTLKDSVNLQMVHELIWGGDIVTPGIGNPNAGCTLQDKYPPDSLPDFPLLTLVSNSAFIFLHINL